MDVFPVIKDTEYIDTVFLMKEPIYIRHQIIIKVLRNVKGFGQMSKCDVCCNFGNSLMINDVN